MPLTPELLAIITDHLGPAGKPGNADGAAWVWQRLFATFRPLLGPLSTETLFVRTLFGHGGEVHWLREAAASPPGEAFALFLRRLQEQAPEEIVTVNRALLLTYATELADLIGDRLASRFLHAAFAPDTAHKDT